ncbi:amino acid transporter AVT3B-like isoform X2 [Anneissia japonica]|uniref:amino acid transporter AVT3B-like isoform X2 n=1 Tax=Anneissia japonica TaxID=1529436 RepID=UPI001425A9E5|nr:amino acid transporter AVT3B-like isoform X2 [Anneissia japonica]
MAGRTVKRLRSNKFVQNVIDFANVFKAFIGTNYLALAFAFEQSGLILGVIGLLVITMVTDHCCQLIVKCKYIVVNQIISEFLTREGITDVASPRIGRLRKRLEKHLTYGDIARKAIGKWGLYLVNFALFFTQFFFCIAYMIFLGNTLQTDLFPFVNETSKALVNTKQYNLFDNSQNNSIVHVNKNARVTTAPVFAILVLFPLPLFLLFVLLRNVRNMGPISVVANISIFVGYGVVLVTLVKDFAVDPDVKYFAIATFPVFFGAVSCAYEGIGTIIPIESSMAENRPKYPAFLHGSLLLLFTMLCSLGILGYLKYGSDVEQILIQNLPSGSITSYIVNVTICIGVAFTYPITVYPIIEILENILFTEGRIFGQSLNTLVVNCDNDNERAPLLSSVSLSTEEIEISDLLPVAKSVPESVASWKRNIVRVSVVLIQTGLAIVFKDQFVYINAINGSIGSTLLAYILPAVISIKLAGQDISRLVFAKNIFLILFGILGGLSGLIVTIYNMVKHFQGKI